jgi:predicted ATPase/DNA-binding SARP family transcriptional activator
MTVRFRLLGEVDVLLDEHRIDVGHARQRSVLAALLVEVNRAVPPDELIDRVWADRPPYRARNALSAYVSRLRRQLVGAPGVRIDRTPAGYVLRADPLTVDLHEVRHLVTQARAASGRPAEAAALYGRALALWPGEPVAEIDTPWFDGLRTSLEAERAAVVLDRNDVALRAGQHTDLLVELADAARAHPLDERLAGQLMLAQYRSGRQADALGTYQRMRERLLDELGADPGAALRQVHQRILTGEAAAPEPVVDPLDAAAATRPAAVAVEPVPTASDTNLPRRATSFVGRTGAVQRVVAALRTGPLVTLTGVGGVGKSRLAIEAASSVDVGYADGEWLCELAPLEDGGPVGHAVAAALQLQQRQGSTIEQTVIEYLRDRELLLVLDNCEHVLVQAAALLDDVLRHCPAVTVLATSREPLGVEGERILPVDPLTADDAAALFADRARATRPDFDLDGEVPGAVAEICRRLDGLPLAIELAAARMRVMNAAEVARRLASPRFVSGGSRATPTRHQSLVATVDWSYRLLSTRERALFARLSVFAGGFDLDGAHAVCGDPADTEDDTLDLLAGLVDKSMVSADHTADTTWYRLLETMRQYGRERLVEDADLDPTRDRHARYLVGLTDRAGVGMLGPDEALWVERLSRAYDDLRVAVQWASTTQDADLALRLVVNLPDFACWRVGYELTDWSEAALRLPGAAASPLAAAVYGGAARGAWCLGDYPRATRLALAAGETDWVEGAARCGKPGDVLAVIAGYKGRIDEAIAHYERQVELARPAADPPRLNWALFHLAMCRAAIHDPLAGRVEAEEALAVARGSGGNPTAVCLGLLGVGRALRGKDPAAALTLLDESAEVAASVRNRWFYAFARMYAAATHGVHSDPVVAANAFLEVLDVWDRLGDWSQQWLSLLYVTRLLIRIGAGAEAVTLHHALVAAARPAPFDPDRLAALARSLGAERFEIAARRGSAMDGPAVVAFVRSSLRAPGK